MIHYPNSVIIWTRVNPVFSSFDNSTDSTTSSCYKSDANSTNVNSTNANSTDSIKEFVLPGSELVEIHLCSREVAKDKCFKYIAHNKVYAKSSSDYTVKIDVTGLCSYTRYWYRFKAYWRNANMIGRTQAIPKYMKNKFITICSNYL